MLTQDLEKDAKAARTLTGCCWMAEGFPMSLRQLLPILGIVGTALNCALSKL